MLPSLRLGFVVPPRWAMATLVAIKNSLDWHCSVPLQLAVAAFISQGHLGRHVRRLRQLYRERRDHLLAMLQGKAGNALTAIPSTYGMHVAALASGEIDCGAVSSALAERGIHIHSLDRYHFGPVTHSGFVLSYATAEASALAAAVDALAEELGRLGHAEKSG
jgi:GntR family transcriptional regulator/MocR family aminotransferase